MAGDLMNRPCRGVVFCGCGRFDKSPLQRLLYGRHVMSPATPAHRAHESAMQGGARVEIPQYCHEKPFEFRV